MSETYDIRYRTKPELHLQLLTKTDDGDKMIERRRPPFLPYCYLRQSEFSERTTALRADGYTLGDDAPEGFVKIEHTNPWEIGNLKYDYEDGIEAFFEADVPFARRVMIDEGIRLGIPEREDVLYVDIETDPRNGFPDPEEANERILSIAASGGDGEEYFFSYENETDTLEAFIELLDDYFVVVGWNSETFDWPYLKARAKRYGQHIPEFAVTHIDLMTLYRHVLPGSAADYKLDTVGETEVDMPKLHEPDDVTELWDWFQNEDDRLREYNRRDVEITEAIDAKYNGVQYLFRIASRSYNRASQLIYTDDHGHARPAVGKCCDSVILRVAYERGVPQPNKGRYSDMDFPGAHVFAPKPGIYHDVATADFSGMYPTIIRTWNIGGDTWVANPSDSPESLNLGARALIESGCTEVFEDTAHLQSRGGFRSNEDSILKVAVERLQDERRPYKEKRNAATRGSDEWKKWYSLDGSIKALLNSFYGVTASTRHRYYVPGMSENITEIGQTLIGETKAFADNSNAVDTVIYGDTDSIIFKMKADDKDTIAVAKAFNEQVNSHIREVAADVCGVDPSLLHVDLDAVFADYFITDSKKKYAGHVVYDNGYCYDLKITGFECIKSDTPPCLADVQERVIKALLAGEATGGIVRDAKHRLFAGGYDEQLIQRVGLGKQIEDYKGDPIQARAAKKIRERKGDGAAQQGEKIPYLKYGPEKEDMIECADGIDVDWQPNEYYCETCDEAVRGEHPHETREAPHFRDQQYSYLWQNRFVKLLDRMGVSEYDQLPLSQFA